MAWANLRFLSIRATTTTGLNRWTEINVAGQLETIRRPWVFTADPIVTANNVIGLPIPPDNMYYQITYDGFGRKVSVTEAQMTVFAQKISQKKYFPLAVESRDAEQLKTGGLHEKAFQRVEFDGRGQPKRLLQHLANPRTEDIVTTVAYRPTGEPGTITRSDGGLTYQRSMEYDSLGRLVVNREPNTGNNWRYVWDDADQLVGTSDARGCGVNLYYDGLGRPVGEDYSPCLASQHAYTAPNLSFGSWLGNLQSLRHV